MKRGKAKQVLAIIGIVILLSLYLVTLVTALMAKPYAHKMFITSLFASMVIPVFIYAFILIDKSFRKKDKDSMSLGQLRRMKKKMSEAPEDETEETKADQVKLIKEEEQGNQ